jgi:hypothetical protein
MHGEVLLLDKIGALNGLYAKKMKQDDEFKARLTLIKDRRPKDFIYDYIFNSQGKSAVGFKYKWDESLSPEWSHYTKLLVDDESIFVIHLWRRDLVAQFVSYYSVTNLGMPTLLHKNDEDIQLSPFSIDIDDFKYFCQRIRDREIESLRMYRNHDSKLVWYEDIVDSSHPSLITLQNQLNLDVVALETTTKKNIADSLKLILNYDEIMSWYRMSEYPARLQ